MDAKAIYANLRKRQNETLKKQFANFTPNELKNVRTSMKKRFPLPSQLYTLPDKERRFYEGLYNLGPRAPEIYNKYGNAMTRGGKRKTRRSQMRKRNTRKNRK